MCVLFVLWKCKWFCHKRHASGLIKFRRFRHSGWSLHCHHGTLYVSWVHFNPNADSNYTWLLIHAGIKVEPCLLTHWGRVTHVCVGKLTIIGSDNGLSPGRRQTIIWTNAGILLIGPLGTNFSEIVVGIQTFSFKKIHLKMSSAKWRPFCLGLNVLSCVYTGRNRQRDYGATAAPQI